MPLSHREIFLQEKNPESAGKFYMAAYTSPDDYSSILEDDIGNFDQVCEHCGSFNNAEEFIQDKNGGHFSLCCHNGKVKLPGFKEPPNEIKNLFSQQSKKSKDFLNDIRSYNSALAFASMKCNLDPLMQKTKTMLFKLFGEVCHLVAKSTHPEIEEERAYGQLYILDTQTATDLRMKNSANSKCDKKVNE